MNKKGIVYGKRIKSVFIGTKQGNAIEYVPVAHAKWEEYWDEEYLAFSYRCSKCKKDALTKEGTMHDQALTPYCPYCGARMDGE